MASPTPSGAIPPPPGVTPDFETPQSLEKWNAVCVAVSLSICSTLFFLRCFVRLYIKREWRLEDYWCCSAWAFLVTLCALNTVLMQKHGGVHKWDLTEPQVHQATKWFNVSSIVYAPAILSTKLAILLLYRNVFSPHRKGAFDLTIRVFIVFLCLFYLSTTIVKIWECNPRERIWNKSVEGTCVNVPALLDASGICNTLTDIIILLMPIHVVWNLKTTYWKKVGVVLVFSVGFIAPAFSLVGVIVRFKTTHSDDTTWNQPSILMWGVAEVSTGIICVCIPPLGILFRRHRPRPQHIKHSFLRDPTNSTVSSHFANISSKGHHYSSRRGPASTDEVNLFEAMDIELQHPGSKGARVAAPAVVTGIVGGKERLAKDKDEEGERSSDGEEPPPGITESEQRAGIMRTVRMEQIYA
ncbi:hypothetical protein ACLMJK_007967 [Lecanora helva]